MTCGPGRGRVFVVHTQADVEDSYFQNAPITTSKEGLIEAPLLRLRDTEFAGEHTSRRNGARRTVMISEYIPIADLAPVRGLLLNFLASGFYNRYYLAPLEDGSYVCVYFDDYLMLRPGEELPTGYVRYAAAEEKTMLRQMAEEYEVDPAYVLDMYRHGKVSWMLDLAIRAGVGLLLLVVGSAIAGKIRQAVRRKAQEDVEP